MDLTPQDEARFWAKVEKRGPDECWLWTSTTRTGYGIFGVSRNGRRRTLSAHRISYWLKHGVLDSRRVCHSCDTPACVNPEHLFLGTAKQNSDDKFVKGRGPGLLDDEQVADIRARPLTITVCRDLASEFGVSPNYIKKVLDGTKYWWLPGARELPPQFTAHKFTPEQIRDILARSESGKWGIKTRLAEEYGVTRGHICHITNNRLLYTALLNTTDTN